MKYRGFTIRAKEFNDKTGWFADISNADVFHVIGMSDGAGSAWPTKTIPAYTRKEAYARAKKFIDSLLLAKEREGK